MKSQSDIFLKGEGDAWFERNKERLEQGCDENDFPIRIINLYQLKPKKVLEIGCSNGFRLDYLKKKLNCECTGIEPSEAAIADGKERFKDITLVKGTASDIPLDETFDLIIVNFVLHWVGREELTKAINEVDRLLAPGGLLIIGDFYPDEPMANKYHHLEDEDVMTYKQDYGQLFIDSFNYKRLALLSTSHVDPKVIKLEKESNDRIAVSLLLK